MPARKPDTPGRIPLHLSLNAGGRKFPQGEIGWIALFRIFLNPGTLLQRLNILVRKLGVIFKLWGVKVNAVAGAIRISLFLQNFYEGNLVVNGIGGFDPDIRRYNI